MTETFIWIAVLLLLAKIAGLIERVGQPPVLGELIMGIILGNLVLVGVPWFESAKHNELLEFLAQLGVVILLFQVGLESNVTEMAKTGWRAFWVAVVGVTVPFILGTYLVGPLIMPGLSNNAYLFLGAALTATSVGITSRVFQDLGKLKIPEAKIILGAAVIDDVLGLIILAVVAAIAKTGTVSVTEIGWISLKAGLFLVGALIVGKTLTVKISGVFALIHGGPGMKFVVAISFCLIFAYVASLAELAPIVGAFAAGLVLEQVHFQEYLDPKINHEIRQAVYHADATTQAAVEQVLLTHHDHHLEELIYPLGYFLIPLFFILIGMQVDLQTLFNPKVLGAALIITAVAFIGKLAAGIVAGSVNKWIVGWGMAPRGEVGLIFAAVGQQIGVVSPEMYSIIIIVVIFTTLFTPPILTYYLKRT
ncbi:sodium/hydrogen exchanger [Thioploca ingrica]|uniref:Sodium/hydrogen exchanger n=1 Tax=Thioploca ingrica TaxID=40754 RepID=A0A090AI86_9GAMM|nr:sodium/hydrogen exchanger [Thioploca ingrica]